MSKIPKIAVSFLLILSIILNPLGSVFDIRAGAVATAAGFGGFIVEFIIDQIVFQVGNQMWQTSINDPEGVYSTAKLAAFSKYENFITATDIVQVEYDIYPDEFGNPAGSYKPTRFYLDPSVILNDEQRESYQLIVDTCNDYLASGGDSDLVCYNIGGAYGFDPIGYEKVKEGIANKLIQNSVDDSVIDMVGNGVLPQYDFSFVGPQPSISSPVINGSAPLQKDGFVFTPPISSTMFNEKNTISIKASAELLYNYKIFESQFLSGDEKNGYTSQARFSCYGYSTYVMYNGKLYYFIQANYTDAPVSRVSTSTSLSSINPSIFYSADGVCLADVYTPGSSYSIGLAINETGAVKSGSPVTASVNESDFNSQIGGGTVDVPRSQIEEIIGRAMELGLAVPDSWIQFAKDGSISSVDGIEVSKLQELIDAVTAGNLGFENMQEYLDLLTKLVGAGNLTASQQKTILDNINAKSIAISDAITKEHTLEDVEFENSYLTVEHTGFKEAKTLVDKLPIINQSKTLLNNLFETTKNQEQNNSSVPNFSFYWDSNKDGVKEKYTLMDLSFMEQRLTNSNLADKGRFSSSMTIRQFIQSLIILIAYSLFVIKLLKRIPSFLSGAGFGGDNVTTSFSHTKGGD